MANTYSQMVAIHFMKFLSWQDHISIYWSGKIFFFLSNGRVLKLSESNSVREDSIMKFVSGTWPPISTWDPWPVLQSSVCLSEVSVWLCLLLAATGVPCVFRRFWCKMYFTGYGKKKKSVVDFCRRGMACASLWFGRKYRMGWRNWVAQD